MSDTSTQKLDFWNSRAQYGEQAGTNDLILKRIEMQIILQYTRDGQSILDVGCGNGITAFTLLDALNVEVTGIDYASKMIEDANERLKRRPTEDQAVASFAVGDVKDLSRVEAIKNRKFDLIITERVLINLSSWQEQCDAMRGIMGLLKPDGVYLMIENIDEGLQSINRLRSAIGLSAIEKPWHNRYLRKEEVQAVDFAEMIEYRDFTSAYYLLSRVVNAWVANKQGMEPSYDSDINKLALELMEFRNFEELGLGQTRLWVWRRKA
jgi:ubiquinone/menaquinone biosynthesis C-methylase UbiE